MKKELSGDNLQRISKIDIDFKSYNICYLNKTREKVNNMYMNFYKSDDALFLEHKKKDEDDRADSIYIYKDLPVMAIVNKLKQNKKSEKIQSLFCNSDAMKVIDFNDKLITMKLDIPDENGNDIVEVKPSEFHKSFVCNYCSTTHKNQGATISQNIQIWDWNRMREDRRIGYTAVSRGKNVQQIKIVK
jgi:ATP-dependent exoDNAse (exonuclease V) alpha subunit